MSARVLVVDDLAPNVKLLETKLSLEYFTVLAATNGGLVAVWTTGGDASIVQARRITLP